MASNSFKVKNSLVLTPKNLSTITNPEAGDLACDINDNNKLKRYDTTTSSWIEVGGSEGSLPDATSLVKGVLKLAGDLGGTADLPTVPALSEKANLVSPALTGTPTAPTASLGTNTTQIATTEFVNSQISASSAISIGPANPDSISVKTSSYTIPAGKSARVRFVKADATINGTAVFTTQNFTYTSPSLTFTDQHYVHNITNISGVFFCSGTIGINSTHTASEIYISDQVPNGAYDTILATRLAPTNRFVSWINPTTTSLAVSFHSTFGGTSALNYWINRANTSARIYNYNLNVRVLTDNIFWVPAGTVLGGTGVIVEEYTT